MSETIPFSSLPRITKFTTMLSFFLGWVLFAEFVIDRFGWDRFLPFYRVGQLCPYDILVIAILAVAYWRLNRTQKETEVAVPTTREIRSRGGCC